MDPLSITASAIAIIQLTTDLITGTRNYYKSARNAPKEITELFDELTSLGIVLGNLKKISKKADAARGSQDGAAESQRTASRLPMLVKMMESGGSLDICYLEMLAFRTKLTKEPSRIKKSLKWPFEKDEIIAVIRRLRNLRDVLITAIASDQLALNLQIQDSVGRINDSLQVAINEELSQRISGWLSAPDPSSNLASARDKRHQETGLWLLNSPAFVKWKSQAYSFLCLYGKPGSWKTVLSSTAIYSLFEDSEPNKAVVYFYFDFQTREKQLFQSFLKFILVQLFRQNKETFKILEKLYYTHCCGRTRPTLQDLNGALRLMIDNSKPIYLIIDALDECEDRQLLLEGPKAIRRWNQSNVHIFTTSPREIEIEEFLRIIATDKIPLEESVVDGDLLSYIRHQMRYDRKIAKWPEDVRKEIENALLDGANGMFRWVECQLDAIRGCMKLGLLRKTLRSLPKTLHETYARILDSIPEAYAEDVRRILCCLIYSFYPLDIQEVVDTVAIVVEGEPYYDVENKLSDPCDILTICSGLISFSGRRNDWAVRELRLALFSVKEYLISDHTTFEGPSRFALEEHNGHETLAKLCICYLHRCIQEDIGQVPGYDRQRPDRDNFGPYAASCWYRHLQAARLASSSPLYYQCVEMLTQPALLRDILGLHIKASDNFNNDIIMSHCVGDEGADFLDAIPPLYYASLLGINQLVIMLLAGGEDVNCSGPEGTCIAAAAYAGHESIVQLLLDKGAEVNAVISQGRDEGELTYSRTAIHSAVESDHEKIVELLLANGADVNSDRSFQGKPGNRWEQSTPLQTAIGPEGTKSMIQLLLSAGADPNFPAHSSLDLPLALAIVLGNMSDADLLIQYGADTRSIDSSIVDELMRGGGSEEFKCSHCHSSHLN